MSYFDSYFDLLEYYEIYLIAFKKSFNAFDYKKFVDDYQFKTEFLEEDYKIYSMCKLTLLLEDVIECLKTNNRERFDSIEPELYYWLKDAMKYVTLIQ